MPKQQIRFISGLQGKAFIIERFFVTFTEENASGGAISSVFLNFIFSRIKKYLLLPAMPAVADILF